MLPKERAGRAALEFVRSGMNVGLGSGSTARCFIDALGEALRQGQLSDIQGIPTSRNSADQATALGIPLTDFSRVEQLDVTVDGADEMTPRLDLIKGLGGALLREKIVAQNSRRLVIVVDESKRVAALGTHSALPVEVAPFSHEATGRFLRTLDCEPKLRMDDKGNLYQTDNGNFIYDCHFKGIRDPIQLDLALKHRAGVIETGLFLGMAHTALVAGEEGVSRLDRA